MQFIFSCFSPTCKFLWHTGAWSAVRWLCTHFPKPCRQEESEWLQICGHDGGFRSKQLEQDVCRHEPWQSAFSRDTNLRSRKLFFLFKCVRGYEGKCVVYTWQSRFQWDGPDSIPSYTLGDSSLPSKDGSLRKTHTHTKQILEELQKLDLTKHQMSREFDIYLLSRAARKDKKYLILYCLILYQ